MDAMKTKQLEKGLIQLMDEGVAQLFNYELGARKVVGTVGALQFEVIQHRLKHEYNATCRFAPMNLFKACWISAENKKKMEEFIDSKIRHIARDKDGKLDNFPEINYHFTSEF
jgi:peptide chain release factor 3